MAEERRRVTAEMEAFEEFAKRVAETPPTAPNRIADAGPTLVNDSSRPTVEKIRRAYRETVMAVDH